MIGISEDRLEICPVFYSYKVTVATSNTQNQLKCPKEQYKFHMPADNIQTTNSSVERLILLPWLKTSACSTSSVLPEGMDDKYGLESYSIETRKLSRCLLSALVTALLKNLYCKALVLL